MSNSDDEYGPLQTTWGSQTPVVADEGAGWDSLRDPNAKFTEKGLGTGQLHRKGRNFKPIDEETIISQRLQKNSSSKKRGSNTRNFSQNSLPTSNSMQNHKKASLPVNSTSQQVQHQKARNKKPSFSTPTSPPTRPTSSLVGRMSRPALPNNAWSSPLVDTPFWESDLPNIPPPQKNIHQSPPSSSFQSSSISNNNKNTTNNNYNNDTQKQQHFSNNNHHRNDNNNQNKGYVKRTPRIAIIHNSSVGEQVSSIVTEPWSPPQISSNGGWGNTDTSKGGWSNDNQEQKQEQQGWGNVHTSSTNNGGTWGNNNNNNTMDKSSESINGWRSANNISSNSNNEWGASSSPSPTSNNVNSNNDNGGWGNSNKATPSWLDSVPENTSNFSSPSSPPLRTQEGSTSSKSGGRFSNKSRKKYSDIPIEVPKPRNYDTNEPVSFPTAVAPPPPPDNDHLITINVELSDTIKVAVPIHELDEPAQLAEKFAAEQNLKSPQILQAIIKLFTSQKDAALLKKRQKLVKKYPSRPHPTNYYTEAFDYPEYLPTVYNNAPSLTTPFTRRAYY